MNGTGSERQKSSDGGTGAVIVASCSLFGFVTEHALLAQIQEDSFYVV